MKITEVTTPTPEQQRIKAMQAQVKRAQEAWVEVSAHTAAGAEDEAMKVLGVMQVFGRSAVRSDEAAAPERPAGVRDE